jgi:hypothetical protein
VDTTAFTVTSTHLCREPSHDQNGVMRLRTEISFRIPELRTRGEVNEFIFERSSADIEIRFPPIAKAKDGAASVMPISKLTVLITIEEPTVHGFDDAIDEHQERLSVVASDVVTEFLDWLKVQGHHMLGVIGERAEQALPIKTFEAVSNTQFKPRPGLRATLRELDSELNETTMSAIRDNMAEGRALPTPESFLADALYLRRSQHRSDLQRAVILSAIACELKVQQVLLQKVPEDRRALVSIILDNRREIEIAKVLLFHKVMKAAIGYSLRDSHKWLYDSLVKLFEMRNKIVHEGRRYPEQDMKTAAGSAESVFDWLNLVLKH